MTRTLPPTFPGVQGEECIPSAADLPPWPLDYSSGPEPIQFVRHVTGNDVTFTTRTTTSWAAFSIAGLIAVNLLFVIGGLVQSAGEQTSWYYAARPIAGVATCGILIVLIGVICWRTWQRHRVPLCVAVVGDRLILILPDRSTMRQEISLSDVITAIVTPVGRTLTITNPADLELRLSTQKRPTLVLHAYPIGDVQAIAVEINLRLPRRGGC